MLQRQIAEDKQRWSVIGWMTKNYYLAFLGALEFTLSRWFRWVMARSPYVYSIRKACAKAVGVLIDLMMTDK
jgi:hypothetical protein